MGEEDFDDDYRDDETGEIDTGVQLGFAINGENIMFNDSNWENWDGGRVGGKPVWLNPVQIPSTADLICKHCNSPMIFLLQIYCPLDDVDNAFHRSLYVFICKKKKCVDNGSVKCFRCQLDRTNEYYPYNSKSINAENENDVVSINDSEESMENSSKDVKIVQSNDDSNNNSDGNSNSDSDLKSKVVLPRLCALCGCKALNSCSKCKIATYCSREHQMRHWKEHKLQCCVVEKNTENLDTNTLTEINEKIHEKMNEKSYLPVKNTVLFPDFDLSISAEILEDLEKVDALNESVLQARCFFDFMCGCMYVIRYQYFYLLYICHMFV